MAASIIVAKDLGSQGRTARWGSPVAKGHDKDRREVTFFSYWRCYHWRGPTGRRRFEDPAFRVRM
jgi:hypothetical protein